MAQESGNKRAAEAAAKIRKGKNGKRAGRKPKYRFAMSRGELRAVRRGRILRVVACVSVLGITLALALIVGTDEYRSTPVGWVPFIAVATCIVLAFVYLQVLKRSIVLLEKSNVRDCRRDETVRFTVRFRNKCPLFAFRMEAHFFTSDLSGKPLSHISTTMALAPFEKYDMGFNTRFEHIGIFQAGLDRVVVYDFLRLFSASLPGPRRVEVQVTPKLVPVSGVEFSNDAIVETTKAARSVISDSMDYAGVRDYAIGDPMKNVHWKLVPRMGELMTKLFEMYTNPGVAVVLDFHGPGASVKELMEMFDAVVESGFSVARFAQSHGFDTEMLYIDKAGELVSRSTWRESDLPFIVADMPQFSNDLAMAGDAIRILDQQLRSPYGQSNIVVCTANLSGEMIETVCLAKAQRREPIVIAVVPKGLEGRERDQRLAPLGRLDGAGVAYLVIEESTDLAKGGRGWRS